MPPLSALPCAGSRHEQRHSGARRQDEGGGGAHDHHRHGQDGGGGFVLFGAFYPVAHPVAVGRRGGGSGGSFRVAREIPRRKRRQRHPLEPARRGALRQLRRQRGLLLLRIGRRFDVVPGPLLHRRRSPRQVRQAAVAAPGVPGQVKVAELETKYI